LHLFFPGYYNSINESGWITVSIKIAIGCCNNIFSEALKNLLEDDREIKVIGIFNCGPGFLSSLQDIIKLNPDVILVDSNFDMNAFLEVPEKYLAENSFKVLLLGDRALRFIVDKHLQELVARGVVGVLPPSADSDLLKKALKAVSSGEIWLDRETLMKLLASMRNVNKDVSLGKREREIAFHICQGYRNKEIAQKLKISEQTVKSHCTRLYKKLRVTDRLQLALHYFTLYPDKTKGV
jgi:DNA-binding NarL/FixJ family response regulator